MLEKGIRGEQTVVVTKELSAKKMGSGELMVYATPAMIALMEKTAYTSVASELEEGMGTVGTLMNVSHIAASPIGMKIHCESELVEVEGRKLTFKVEAYDETGKIDGEKTIISFCYYLANIHTIIQSEQDYENIILIIM